MRAALSILGLVIAFAFVMYLMKKQLVTLKPPAAAASAASSAAEAGGAAALPRPDAVRLQVESALQQSAQKASEAMP
ncbi:hypothetical protein [Paucibacter sp. KCTC 42545]|uniref:hypothetical protein n=1 Tax=Paucibacter sp. KCTC 42545 TaxID=1768242 RepID=UPI0012E39D42|nr:hypothetical protein [Paucibacter sp. KCTC 42545]